MILRINLAILTFLSFLSNFLKYFRVGRYKNIFIFIWKAIKIAGSAQKKTGSVGLVETRVFFLGLSKPMERLRFYRDLSIGLRPERVKTVCFLAIEWLFTLLCNHFFK